MTVAPAPLCLGGVPDVVAGCIGCRGRVSRCRASGRVHNMERFRWSSGWRPCFFRVTFRCAMRKRCPRAESLHEYRNRSRQSARYPTRRGNRSPWPLLWDAVGLSHRCSRNVTSMFQSRKRRMNGKKPLEIFRFYNKRQISQVLHGPQGRPGYAKSERTPRACDARGMDAIGRMPAHRSQRCARSQALEGPGNQRVAFPSACVVESTFPSHAMATGKRSV